MKTWIYLLLGFVLFIGCKAYRPDEFEKKTFLLKSGMNTESVSNLFSDFRVLAVLDDDFSIEGSMTAVTRRFQTNQICSKRVLYALGGKTGFDPISTELCVVYFDTNSTIIAYRYQLGDTTH